MHNKSCQADLRCKSKLSVDKVAPSGIGAIHVVRSDEYFLPIWYTKELNKQLILDVYWLDDNSEVMII